MGLGSILASVLGAVVKFVIKYWKVIKNWVKATLKWLKDKIKEKLRGKKNGQVLVANTSEVKNVALELAKRAKQEGRVQSLAELEETVQSVTRLEQEGQKNMMVDIDGNVVGDWEAVQDEDQDVRRWKGNQGYVLLTQ